MSGDIFQQVGVARQRDRRPIWRGYGEQGLIAGYFVLLAFLYFGPGVILGFLYGDWSLYGIFAVLFSGAPAGVILALSGLVVAGVIGVVIWLNEHLASSTPPFGAWRIARALGVALAEPDDNMLPLAAAQPDPLAEHDLAATHARLALPGQLTLAPQFLNPWLILGVVVTILFTIAQVDIPDGLRVILNSAAPADQDKHIAAIVSNAAGAVFVGNLVCACILAGVIALSIRPTLRATATGLIWRRLFHRITVPWASITAIGAYSYAADSALAGETTYVIASDAGVITWREDPAKLKRAAAGNHLLRLATTRAGLPVNDMRPLVKALVAETWKKEQSADSSASIVALLPRAATLLALPAVVQGAIRERRMTRLITTLCVLLCFGPLMAALAWQTAAQPSYFATLPTKIHAKAPIFTDDLRAPDGMWPVQRPSRADYRGFAYTPQGYALTSSDSFNQAVLTLIPGQYGAVALQVTVVENTLPSSGDQVGAGLILRGEPSSGDQDGYSLFSDCSFTVDATGGWMFNNGMHSMVNPGASGQRAVIRTGPGEANTLLVIARGNLYIGYVNGQYVGQYYDATNQCGARGEVGVVSRNGTMQATFTAFTIWSVNPPPALNYV